MTAGAPSVDWKSLIAQAQPRRKSVRLCLRGDLLFDLESARGAGNGERVGELEQQVAGSTVEFVLAGLNSQKYRQLLAAHKTPDDDSRAWNDETFPEDLVRKCLISPQIGADEPLFDVLTQAQIEQLFEAAFLVCNEVDDLPLLKRG